MPSSTDYGGVIIDASNDARTAQMFLANPRGIQYDAITSDAADEDSAPDFFWESAATITQSGWTLEMRIPFASLRYKESDPEQWGILLYRNWPREYRYQMFTSRLPRDSNCFICNVRPLTGLAGLPSGSHFVIAPYANANQMSLPAGDLGSPLVDQGGEGEFGLDAKWLPNPNTIFDATLNPDFSQIESDTAQIAANERFALFFPEKRQFFLEGVDLFSTPINAVFTRTFTAPRWGTRATGELGEYTYTMLVGEDRGGGSVIIPGANSSEFATQDFESFVGVGRLRRSFGQSFASFLMSAREIDGRGHNRVYGPDFRWQVNDRDVVTGQVLFSDSLTPNRPDLAEEWDGRGLSGHAARLWWNRQTGKWDIFAQARDVADDFRADNGFVPQVGIRQGLAEVGRSFYPEDKPVSRLRLFFYNERTEDRDGRLILREITPGFAFDAKKDSFVRFEFRFDEVLGIERTFDRHWVHYFFRFTPSKRFTRVELNGNIGDQVDFANDRARRWRHRQPGSDDPADRPSRAATRRDPPLARRDRRTRRQRPAFHGRGPAAEGDLHLQREILATDHRPVDRHRAAARSLHLRDRRRRRLLRRLRRIRLQAQLADRPLRGLLGRPGARRPRRPAARRPPALRQGLLRPPALDPATAKALTAPHGVVGSRSSGLASRPRRTFQAR